MLLVLTLTPLLILLVYAVNVQRQIAVTNAQQESLKLAEFIANSHRQALDSTQTMLTVLAEAPIIRKGDMAQCNPLLKTLMERLTWFTNIFLIDTQGNVVCSGIDGQLTTNVADRDWFKAFIAKPEFTIGDFNIGSVSGKPVQRMIMPAYNPEDEFTFLVIATLDLNKVSSLIGRVYLPDYAELTAIDNKGRIVYRFPRTQEWYGKPFEYPELRMVLSPDSRGDVRVIDKDENERLFGIAPLASQSGGTFIMIGVPTSIVYNPSDRLLLQNIAAFALVTALTLGIALWGSRELVLRQIHTLIEATGQIASGNFEKRSKLANLHGEVGTLATAFDKMAAALEVREGQLKRANAELVQEIQERKRIEAELVTARDDLEMRVQERTAELVNANNEISSFAYIVSHDLRTPLVNLKGFSSELREAVKIIEPTVIPLLDTLPEDKVAPVYAALQTDIPEALRFIEAAVTRMDRLTGAVLKLSRLGRKELRPEPLAMDDLMRSLVESMGHDMKQKNVVVSIENLPVIQADRVAMEQIMGNLLSNAINYLRPDVPGQVQIQAEQEPSQTTFRVVDNGRGIAAGDSYKVFEPFRRAGREDVPGEGMGLAYVQTLVRRHGGRIWYNSQVDVGSTFSFTIPRVLPPDMTPPPGSMGTQ